MNLNKTKPNIPTEIYDFPVPFFGDYKHAKVGTISINPSGNEFINGHIDLYIDDRERALLNYFNNNPYRNFFDHLEVILNIIGASYYNGTACHIDVSPWATKKAWTEVEQPCREAIIDLEMLRETTDNLDVLIINGRTAISEVSNIFTDKEKLDNFLKHANSPVFDNEMELFSGKKIRVLAWTTFASKAGFRESYKIIKYLENNYL